ncbi:MAG: APC family permease [Lachnospiraceae bacterium]|nr:APC family permease [Lachnospiraceae bacterium]MDD7435250.1 APC family permease [Lachnospiraceae bacterium]MDY3342165.1 APC family permease [Lachnospiraceae bacterium]MDY4877174.1 APC family permease [Eubacterium sp.]
MEEKDRTLGLRSVVSISVGLVIATSCLVSLGQGAGSIGVVFIGAMVIACLLNMTTVASLSELNALMPNTTGGLAQYTLACLGPFPTLISMVGGYLICNIMSSGVEASIFSYAMASTIHLPIPSILYTLVMTIVVMIANLYGVDMFAKIQDLVAFLLVGSMLIMGIIGMFGLGTGAMVQQPYSMVSSWKEVVSMVAVAFWLFIGAEYVIPVSKNVKNAKRNVPLGMMIGLALICLVQSIMVLGFHNYTPWGELEASAAPHLLYGENLLGSAGKIWMTFVAALAVVSTQNSTVNGLAGICQGMAKMNMMPRIFAKTNKHGVPFFGVIFVSVFIFVFAALSDGSSEAISFLILVGSVFWMISYIFAHLDVLILRHRLPKAPRSFKVPCGPLFPCIGIAGTVYMILNISTDPTERMMIWLVTGITFLILGIYSFFWIRIKMKMPVFKSVPIQKVMAMENSMYYTIRKRRGLWR